MTRLHVAAVVVLSLLPAAAIAHSPIKGLDNFYAGFLHPLFVPAHLLPILVLGFLFGQQGPARLQAAIIVFLVAVVGGLAATLLSPGWSVELALLVGAAVTGVLVALSIPLPLAAYVALAALLGLMVGIDSAQDDLSGRGRLAALLGTCVSAYLLLLYAMVFADFFTRREWQRIGLRIAGSWVAASALLVLSLSIVG